MRGIAAERLGLARPGVDHAADLGRVHLGERQVVARREAHDPAAPRDRLGDEERARGLCWRGPFRKERGEVVVEREGARVGAGCARRSLACCRGRGSSRHRRRAASRGDRARPAPATGARAGAARRAPTRRSAGCSGGAAASFRPWAPQLARPRRTSQAASEASFSSCVQGGPSGLPRAARRAVIAVRCELQARAGARQEVALAHAGDLDSGFLAAGSQHVAVHLALGGVDERVRGEDRGELLRQRPGRRQEQPRAGHLLALRSPLRDRGGHGGARQLCGRFEAAAHERLGPGGGQVLGRVVGLAREALVAELEPAAIDHDRCGRGPWSAISTAQPECGRSPSATRSAFGMPVIVSDPIRSEWASRRSRRSVRHARRDAGPDRRSSSGRPRRRATCRSSRSALAQLRNVARLPFVFRHVAAMPDVHLGMGATVGSVIATRGAIVPAAVGVDIGCGMEAVRTTLRATRPARLARRPSARAIEAGGAARAHEPRRARRPRRVGRAAGARRAGRGARSARTSATRALVEQAPEGGPQRDARRHLGTLGTGNHFIELCLDEADRVWVMLHSGSRGIGNRIGSHFIERAKQEMERWFVDAARPRPRVPAGVVRAVRRTTSRRSAGPRTTPPRTAR